LLGAFHDLLETADEQVWSSPQTQYAQKKRAATFLVGDNMNTTKKLRWNFFVWF